MHETARLVGSLPEYAVILQPEESATRDERQATERRYFTPESMARVAENDAEPALYESSQAEAGSNTPIDGWPRWLVVCTGC